MMILSYFCRRIRRMKKLTLLTVFLSLTILVRAQLEAPGLICVEVDAAGGVTLTWQPVADPTGIFTEYSVFHRPDAVAPFTRIGQVTDISTVTFYHAGAAADDRSRFYYLQAESTQGPSETSDTVETIFLYFETDDYENITLLWNAAHDPSLPVPDVSYRVFREYPPGNWELLTTTKDLVFDHHFWYCNTPGDVVNFQVITLALNSGCQCESNIFGDILSNTGPPDRPRMDSVSVDPSGGVVIGWQPGLAEDIEGYVIYRIIPGFKIPIDTVLGIESHFYLDTEADPCAGPLGYAIASIDSCDHLSPGTFTTPHSTVFLEEIEYDACLLRNTLRWTAYRNFDPPLSGYELFFSSDGGITFQSLDTVPPQDTSYIHTGLASNTTYSYYVRAYTSGNGKTSTSCKRERRTFNSPIPEFLYCRFASVLEDGSVDFAFYADTSAHLSSFGLYRAEGSPPVYTYLGEIPVASQDVYHVIDPSVNPMTASVFYRFVAIDSCGNEHESSNRARTILLQVESNEDLTVDLTWSAYEEWDGGVGGYLVFRRTGEGQQAQEIGSASPGVLTFSDDISSLTGTGGRISYYVTAYEAGVNRYGFSDQARSNEVTADVIERVFVPNAFAPKGVNSLFRPVGAFISGTDYLFCVYNRWGQLLFDSTAPSEAWDGKYNGAYVASGTYVYILRFTTATGDLILRKGTVTVLF